MTGIKSTGAPLTKRTTTWPQTWTKIWAHVFRLQMRIAKAEREGRKGKVKALQRLLTSSFYAKCLAVRRVTKNAGGKTPGVDGVTWRGNRQKMQAVSELRRRGYRPSPLKRIYIPKKSGKKMRPLSIPTLKDRAMQALWHAALLPIAEERADPNAYGFRPKRSAHDAIEQCFKSLGRTMSSRFVLEGDIRACFDQICHRWLEKNIPMDKTILGKFLKAGFMEKEKLYPTLLGTPQGGIISPTLAVMALSGLERKLVSTNAKQRAQEKINLIAYADDFVVTAASEELLREKVIPILKEALQEVGLELSLEKIRVTQIEKGFDFLGFNVRKYGGKLLIKPSKASIKRFLKEIKHCIKVNQSLATENLIHMLNLKITGWSNYYRSAISSQVFSKIDHEIFQAIFRWCQARHPNKGIKWIRRKYYTCVGGRSWQFYCIVKDKDGLQKPLYLKHAGDNPIRRHKKIKAIANPFDPRFKDYFEQRINERRACSINKSRSTGLYIQPYAGLSGVHGNVHAPFLKELP